MDKGLEQLKKKLLSLSKVGKNKDVKKYLDITLLEDARNVEEPLRDALDTLKISYSRTELDECMSDLYGDMVDCSDWEMVNEEYIDDIILNKEIIEYVLDELLEDYKNDADYQKYRDTISAILLETEKSYGENDFSYSQVKYYIGGIEKALKSIDKYDAKFIDYLYKSTNRFYTLYIRKCNYNDDLIWDFLKTSIDNAKWYIKEGYELKIEKYEIPCLIEPEGWK